MPKKTKADAEEMNTIEEPVEETVEAPTECEMDTLIRKYTYGAVGIGFIPIPIVDLAGLTALQLKMISHISKSYGVEFKKNRAKSIISALCGGTLTVLSVPVFASLFKAIPVIGQTAGAATASITGAASTYALGYVFNKHFKEGGTLLDVSVDDMKEGFTEYYKKGEKAVKDKLSKSKTEEADTTAA